MTRTRTINQIAADWVALDARADDIKWQRGRLAQEAFKIVELDELARRVGIAVELLNRYRLVADAWPTPVEGLSYSVHIELQNAGKGGDYAYAQRLVDEGKTSVEALRAELGRKPARGEGEVRRGLGLLSPEKRQEIIREEIARQPEIVREEIARRPEVVREVMQDQPDIVGEVVRQVNSTPEDRRTFDRVRQEETTRYLNSHGVTTPPQRPRTEFDDTGEWIVARAEVAKATGAVRAAANALAETTLGDEIRARLTEDVARLSRWIDVLRERIAGQSLDEELRQFLESNS